MSCCANASCSLLILRALVRFSFRNNAALIRPLFPLIILCIFVAASACCATAAACRASKSCLSRANAIDICADSRDALRAGLAELLLNHTGRATDRMGYKCYIEPLDLRDGGPTMLIHMDGHRGPAPLEPAARVSRQLHVRGPGWDRWSLYIAGLNNTGCAIAPNGAGGPTRVGAGRRQRLLRAKPAWAGTKMCR